MTQFNTTQIRQPSFDEIARGMAQGRKARAQTFSTFAKSAYDFLLRRKVNRHAGVQLRTAQPC